MSRACPAGSLLGMVVGQGMTLAAIGLAIGLVLALGAFGSMIALLASWIPARRVGRVDPLVALGYE